MNRLLAIIRRFWLTRRQHSVALQLASEREELLYLRMMREAIAWDADIQSDLINQRERVEILEGEYLEICAALEKP